MIEPILGSSPTISTWVGLAVAFGLALGGTIKICATYDGVAVPVWLIFNWLFPFIGPLIVLIYSPVTEVRKTDRSLWREFLTEEPHRKYLRKDEQTAAFESWRESQRTEA